MSLVLDASLTPSWQFEDERAAAADKVLGQVAELGAIVPSHWRLEVAYGFQSAMGRGRVNAAFRDQALLQLARMSVTVDVETDDNAWGATYSRRTSSD